MLYEVITQVENPEEILVLANRDSHMDFPHGLSYLDYKDYREQNDVLQDLAIYTPLPIGISGQGHALRTWGRE